MRCHETWAFWMALNNFAAWDDFVASLMKQARYVEKAAISQLSQPVPRTLRPPNQMTSIVPIMAMTL